jgi:hypothetical protein
VVFLAVATLCVGAFFVIGVLATAFLAKGFFAATFLGALVTADLLTLVGF